MVWNTLLGVNSFIAWPITSVFLMYSIGAVFLFGTWEQLGIAIVLFAASIVTEVILGILSE